MTELPLAALHADGPAPDRAAGLALYGFLVGSWDMETLLHPEAGAAIPGRGEIHGGWVLAGRAIQDVWILPGVFHGTTIRVFDPGLEAWHIHWLDPVMQFYPSMIGRAEGPDIVQHGTKDTGERLRWSFREIRSDSFHWLGEVGGGGDGWRIQLDVRATRRG